MIENESFKIRFSATFEPESLKLFEISPEMIDDLSSELQTWTIRGNPEDNVVIVNQSQTFRVNLVETSNTLLLVRPALTNAHIQQVHATPNHHYELIKAVPDMKPLVDTLNLNCIDVDHLNVLYSEPGSATPSGVLMYQLQNIVQASDAEIRKELSSRHAIEVQGRWFSVDMRLISTVLSEVIDIIQACSMSMGCLSFKEIATELSDAYPSLLVRHVLRIFETQTHSEPTADLICLDEKLVSQQIAIRIFLEQPRMSYTNFMEKWRLELSGPLQADESFLKGIAYLDETTLHKHFVYIPIEKLPMEPKSRFDFLFGLRAKWPAEDMLAFIQDVVARGYPSESIIMKYSKPIQKGQYYVAKTVSR